MGTPGATRNVSKVWPAAPTADPGSQKGPRTMRTNVPQAQNSEPKTTAESTPTNYGDDVADAMAAIAAAAPYANGRGRP